MRPQPTHSHTLMVSTASMAWLTGPASRTDKRPRLRCVKGPREKVHTIYTYGQPIASGRHGHDMRLTAFTDYSLRVLIYVATAPEGHATIAQVARAFDISEHHLVKVVHLLGREGLLLNTRGRKGGLALARAPAAINVGAVVRATEGRDVLAECFREEGRCVLAPACRLSGVLADALAAFYRVLDRHSLADLVGDHSRLASILHFQPRAS